MRRRLRSITLTRLQPVGNMPGFYSSWLYHLDPFTYLIGGLLGNVLHDQPVNCLQSELSVFQPPQGQTCQQWAGDVRPRGFDPR